MRGWTGIVQVLGQHCVQEHAGRSPSSSPENVIAVLRAGKQAARNAKPHVVARGERVGEVPGEEGLDLASLRLDG